MSRPGIPSETRPEHTFELTGGALCLDFVNTLEDRPLCRLEHLFHYSDLLSWSLQAGVVSGSAAKRLARRSKQRVSAARQLFLDAIALRECLFRIFSKLAAGGGATAADLSTLNRWLVESSAHLQLIESGPGFNWDWIESKASLQRPLWPVARSAADLLTSDEAARVRECAAESCSWLFVDCCRTQKRRWCDMKTCGNRNKAKLYYQRHRKRSKN